MPTPQIAVWVFMGAWLALLALSISLCVRLYQTRPVTQRATTIVKYLALFGGPRFRVLLFGGVHRKLNDRIVTRLVYACRLALVIAAIAWAWSWLRL